MLSVTFVLILLPLLIFSKATLYETNFCTCTLLSLDNVQSVVYCAFPPTHAQTTKNLTSPNCKIPLGACFINTSHSSTGLPTEDYGELLECDLCFPDQRGTSTVAKHGEQRDQPRLDTCIPDTRGWCPVRKAVDADLFGAGRLLGA